MPGPLAVVIDLHDQTRCMASKVEEQ